jgi:hypothetical protein
MTEILDLQGMEPIQDTESFASSLSIFCVAKG